MVGAFLIGIPTMILGNYIGEAFFAHYGNHSYRKVAVAVSFVLGFVTLVSSLESNA